MEKLLTQRDYWNSRAVVKGNYGPPLNLSHEEIDFQQKRVVPGGNTMILGATLALCAMARDISDKVIAVDFAEDIIRALRMDGVDYRCQDWNEFFENNTESFDNIMTDGGLLCLEYPTKWREITKNVHAHLKPGGIFSAKFYVSTPKRPKDSLAHPSLNRFMTLASHKKDGWMVTPTHPDYKRYEVHYALPPESAILQAFDQFEFLEKLKPDYEAGERFLSFAWKKS